MGLFRLTLDFQKIKEENFNSDIFYPEHKTRGNSEWSEEGGIYRINQEAWKDRYEYEANLINHIIKENPFIKNVLELGSGPGILSQKIQEVHPNLNYHLIDKPFAKKYFEKNNFKGKFFTKDLSCTFNTKGLLPKYDLVITNDFLEHILNPSIIVQNIHKLTNPESIYFISNPNWRMAHQWIYRGLFDWDNFIYFLYTHKFDLYGFYGSPIKTTPPDTSVSDIYPKRDSESLLPDEHLDDWNHYLLFKHRKI